MMVILTGNIDLSVSWTMNLSAVLLTSIAFGQDDRFWLGALAALGVGVVVGLLNGLGVAYLRIPSMVLTLGMNALVKGVTILYTGAQPKGDAPPLLNFIVHHRLGGGLSLVVVIWIIVAIVSIIVLQRSGLGRKIYAVGNNEVATYLSGVNTNLVLVSVFVIAGVMNAVAGILLTGYAGRSYNEMGEPYLLPSIAAVVVGGTSILGGSGLYSGAIAGVIIITLLESALSILQISPAGRSVIFGLVILVMLFLYGRGARVRE
jgi:ribose transport system permease protein